MYYLVDEEIVSFEEFKEQLEEAVRNDISDHYDEILDNSYEPYKMGGLTFDPSTILKRCDEVAYRCGINDYVSMYLTDALSGFEDATSMDIDGIKFESQEPTYQVWVLEVDVDGYLLEDHGHYLEEFDDIEDAQDYLNALTPREVEDFIVDTGHVVAKGGTYRISIETVIQVEDGEVNVEDVDSIIFTF